MVYCLSNMADMTDVDVSGNETVIKYDNKTADIVSRFPGLGIELTELCISSNNEGSGLSSAILKMKHDIENSKRTAIVHGPFNELFPTAIDSGALKLAYDRYKTAVETTLSLGLGKIVIHSGFVPKIYYPSWFTERSVIFWKRFISEVPGDYTIVLENVMDESPDDMLSIVENVSDPHLALCLDIGHANVCSSLPVSEWIRCWGKHLKHYHIHNNDGKKDTHNLPGEGSMNIKKILTLAEELTPDATSTLEIMNSEKGALWLSENGFLK